MVSKGARRWVAPLVRQLMGDGIAETIVTPDDLTRPGREPDLHGHALWELGLAPEAALAVAGTPLVTTGYSIGGDFTGAAEVRSCYDGLLAGGCEQLHRRWQAGR